MAEDAGSGPPGAPIGTDELLEAVARVPQIPLRAGDYKIRELLGKGAMGSVYLAEHEIFGTRAIKIVNELIDREQRQELERRFKLEARALSRLNHPNVVQVYEFGHLDDGRPYYVMELLQGWSLRAVLGPDLPLADERTARARLPLGEALRYLEQICAGLQAAHDQRVIHRDLKPENIFILDKKPLQLKILDFGIAKMLAATLAGVTKAGPLGTPFYMPPEQAQGRHEVVGPANDIYAVGVILYRVLAGRLPFEIKDEAALLQGGAVFGSWPVVPLRAAAPDVPGPVARLVEQCLDKDPARRPPSAGALYDAMAEAVESRVATAATSRAPRRPAALFALGCALMALLIGGVWLGWRVYQHSSQRGAGLETGEMVHVPAGVFPRGSAAGAPADERPRRAIYLDAYRIDKYTVSVAQYLVCVRAGTCTRPSWDDGRCQLWTGAGWKHGNLPESFRGQGQPVVCVDWHQARVFCRWAQKRLPSEAEWEKAARGTTDRSYPWGEAGPDCSRANFLGDDGKPCRGRTAPVQALSGSASPYGAIQLVGNVWQWNADWYAPEYYRASPTLSPKGPSSPTPFKVCRGGSWHDSGELLRVSARNGFNPGRRTNLLGFRCARTVER